MASLNERIKESGIKKSKLAEMLGISKQSLSNKLHGRVDFSANEALIICKALNIDINDFEYFFAQELEKC